jgi:glycosyltransferase involved in cell wall biosynthesis
MTYVEGSSYETDLKKAISVIVAVRNEEEYIDKCLDSLIKQDIPHEKYEIIVIDGMSDDKTPEILSQYQSRFPHLIRIFDNPKRFQSIGRNIGVKNAEGEVVIFFNGHSYADSRYVGILFNALRSSPPEIAAIGTPLYVPDDETFFNKAMAYVQMSFLGGGGTTFRLSNRKKYVDTTPLPAYKKEIVESVGLHDERLHDAEDLELQWKIRKKGYKLMICHDARVYYYRKHNSFRLLAKKMINYGISRAIVTKKHPRAFKLPIFMPALMIISIALLPIFVLFYSLLADVILATTAVYLAAILISSLYLSLKRCREYLFTFIVIYIIEHFSTGLGIIIGLFTKLPE